MTESTDKKPANISDVAAESPEESVRKEDEATADRPDTGGTVPGDDSQ
ncbi:hypothetical protein [Ornithinimicrobium sufpigmenti]|nr:MULTISPECIES: hypothetical protein [unclassified Ornithinimicrobium]